MSAEPTIPVSQPKRLVSHEQARQAYNHMHGALFNGKQVPCLSIPPQPGDVDMILCDYIDQQAERDRELQQTREQLAQVVTMESAWKAMGGPKLRAELSSAREELAECKRVSLENLLSDQESYDEAREEIARLKEALGKIMRTTAWHAAYVIADLALHPVPEKPKS